MRTQGLKSVQRTIGRTMIKIFHCMFITDIVYNNLIKVAIIYNLDWNTFHKNLDKGKGPFYGYFCVFRKSDKIGKTLLKFATMDPSQKNF